MKQTFTMRAPDGFFAKLDDLRRDEDGIPSRAEIVRRLVERASKKDVEAQTRAA